MVLARWLGPWSGTGSLPRGVIRRPVEVAPESADDRAFPAFFYVPAGRAPRGAYLVTPGLHFLGPGDPRLDRFCRVLAASGLAALSPFLPDHLALRVTPRTPGDLGRALEALLRQPEIPPGGRAAVFSISFGSSPALRVAADPRFADRVRALVLFGGYVDFRETIRFALTGEVEGRRPGRPDPLNRPVVFLNVADVLDGMPADRAPLLGAWHRFCVETWGRREMKDGGWRAVAERIAGELPLEARALFRIGVGLDEGTREVAEAALARVDTAFADPASGGLDGIRCPVHAVHGVDDDVIPVNQLARLAAALPPHVRVQAHQTGLYGHSDRAGLPGPVALARELWTMARVVRALAEAPG